jgi:hypothetical protein
LHVFYDRIRHANHRSGFISFFRWAVSQHFKHSILAYWILVKAAISQPPLISASVKPMFCYFRTFYRPNSFHLKPFSLALPLPFIEVFTSRNLIDLQISVSFHFQENESSMIQAYSRFWLTIFIKNFIFQRWKMECSPMNWFNLFCMIYIVYFIGHRNGLPKIHTSPIKYPVPKQSIL